KLRDSMRDSTAFRVLDSVIVAGLIVGLEVWNLTNELDLSSQTSREKSENRADAALYSAGLDLLIAMEALTVKLASSSSFLAAARKTIFTIPEALAERLLGPLSEYLVKEYSARLFSQI